MNPSVSTIADFISCPLKFRLKHIVGLRKIEDESAEHHLRFGAAMHKAMEVIYRWRMHEPRQLIKPVVIRLAQRAFMDAYPRQLDENDHAKTQESGCFAIEDYVRRYAGEDAMRWRVLAVESPEMYDNGFITHLDMVAENMEHGGIYGFDFKFTKKSFSGLEGYRFWAQFEPNSQIARYCDFIKSKYGSCEGFYIRATSFGYRSRQYKGQPAGFYVNHQAQLFNVNEDQIQNEIESSAYWQGAIEAAIEGNIFGMNTDHCSFCSFRPICMSGWRWPRDEMNILNRYRLICNELTPTLRACALEPGHSGEHSEQAPVVGDFSIKVEV